MPESFHGHRLRGEVHFRRRRKCRGGKRINVFSITSICVPLLWMLRFSINVGHPVVFGVNNIRNETHNMLL